MQVVTLGGAICIFCCKTISYIPTLQKYLVKIFNCNVRKKFSCNYVFLLLTLNLDFEEMMFNNLMRFKNKLKNKHHQKLENKN